MKFVKAVLRGGEPDKFCGPSVGVKEHDFGWLSKGATWQSEEVEAAWRESGATVQMLKRGCVGREFLTSAGLAALVDNENADDWMARLSVLKTSIFGASSGVAGLLKSAGVAELWVAAGRRASTDNTAT